MPEITGSRPVVRSIRGLVPEAGQGLVCKTCHVGSKPTQPSGGDVHPHRAEIAQQVERPSEKREVAGSTPALGTNTRVAQLEERLAHIQEGGRSNRSPGTTCAGSSAEERRLDTPEAAGSSPALRTTSWACSSNWESACFARRGLQVRVLSRPPLGSSSSGQDPSLSTRWTPVRIRPARPSIAAALSRREVS